MLDNILIVIDMQNDFIDGSLGSTEALDILENANNFIEHFDGEIIFTLDTHDENYLNTNEGKHLPIIHCRKNTLGHSLNTSLKKFVKDDTKIFEKDQFSSLDLVNYLKSKNNKYLNINLLGLCTDICVVSNALLLKTFFPESHICVISKACAGSTKEKHEAALNVMESCQIEIL